MWNSLPKTRAITIIISRRVLSNSEDTKVRKVPNYRLSKPKSIVVLAAINKVTTKRRQLNNRSLLIRFRRYRAFVISHPNIPLRVLQTCNSKMKQRNLIDFLRKSPTLLWVIQVSSSIRRRAEWDIMIKKVTSKGRIREKIIRAAYFLTSRVVKPIKATMNRFNSVRVLKWGEKVSVLFSKSWPQILKWEFLNKVSMSIIRWWPHHFTNRGI